MTFSNFVRTVSGNIILFSNSTAIENINKIIFFKDNSFGNFSKKEFRWSFNKTYWSSWTGLDQKAVTSITMGTNKYLFLEVRYTSSGSGTCTYFSIDYNTSTSTSSTSTACQDTCSTTSSNITTVHNAELLCNKSPDYYLSRTNHKGSQPISSIEGLQTVLNELESNSGGDFKDYIDGSLLLRDISIENIYQNGVIPGIYVNESSLNLSSGFAWSAGLLYVDVSVVAGGVTIAYVDGSLLSRDSSINWLYSNDISQDASISNLKIYIDGSLLSRDSSLNLLFSNDISQDASISNLKIYLDGSLSLRDSSINWLYTNDISQDASISNLKIYLDGSLAQKQDLIPEGFYVKDVSLSSQFYWQDGSLFIIESSAVSGVSKSYVDGSLSYRDTSINNIWLELINIDSSVSSINSILMGKISDVSTVDGTLGYELYSNTTSNIAYIKRISGSGGISLSSDSSLITISLIENTKYSKKYLGTFNGTSDSSFNIPSSLHLLGIGPLTISIYENNEQIYIGTQCSSNGDIRLSWTPGSITDPSCKFIVIG